MKWAIKFPTKGKRDGLTDGQASQSQGSNNNNNNHNGTGKEHQRHPQYNSEKSTGDNRSDEDDGHGTPAGTPPDAANGHISSGNGNGRAVGGREKARLAGEQVEEQPPDTGEGGGGGSGGAGNLSAFGGDNGRAHNGGAGSRYVAEEEDQGVEEWEVMNGDRQLVDEGDGEAGGNGVGAGTGGEGRQDDVLDDDSQDDAGSLHAANKMTRIRSFADDPEGHDPRVGDWDGIKEGGSGEEDGEQRGSPRMSRGDDRSGTGGAGSHSYHSETRSADNAGTEEYNSNASPEHPGATAKSNTYTSFGGMSGGGMSVAQSEGELLQGGRAIEEHDEDGEDDDDQEDFDGDEHHNSRRRQQQRHHNAVPSQGNNNGDAGLPYDSNNGRVSAGAVGAGMGVGGPMRARDQAESRAHAHAYADELDMSQNPPGYAQPRTGGGYASGGAAAADRSRPSGSGAFPPPPPQGGGGAAAGVNGLSAVDARVAAALAARTRLTTGGTTVAAGGAQRPESGPVLAAGQAAAAAAAALRRGPTPGSHSLPSMVLVPLEALKAHRRVPRSSDRRALVRYRDLPDRSRSFVVFVSHAWMRPHTTPSFAHPDTSSRGGEKYRLIAEAGDRIRAHLPPDVRVLLWIDYSCVDQDSTRRSKATMRGMREYMRRCDAILTVYPGDAADNGEEFLPNRFVKSCSWAGSYKSLAHYCTRGWCRLEMLLGQTEPLPQDGFMFNFLVPKKKKASGAKASVGDRPHFLYGAHQRPHNGRIDVVPRQSSRWFEEHHPEQGNFTHESDRDAIRAVLAKQTSTMAKKTAAIAARYGTDPRRGGGGNSSSNAV